MSTAVAGRQEEVVETTTIIAGREVQIVPTSDNQKRCCAHFPAPQSGRRIRCSAAATVKIMVDEHHVFACESEKCQEKAVRLISNIYYIPALALA